MVWKRAVLAQRWRLVAAQNHSAPQRLPREHNSTAALPAPELLCKTTLVFLPLFLLPYPKA